jgi:hypothetical protein
MNLDFQNLWFNWLDKSMIANTQVSWPFQGLQEVQWTIHRSKLMLILEIHIAYSAFDKIKFTNFCCRIFYDRQAAWRLFVDDQSRFDR